MNNTQQHRYSKDCDCSNCDRNFMAARGGLTHFLGPMWDSCEIRYRIKNEYAARDIDLCLEMPAGWSLGSISLNERYRCFEIMFQVQGVPRESDGAIVYRILQRMGAL